MFFIILIQKHLLWTYFSKIINVLNRSHLCAKSAKIWGNFKLQYI